MLMKIVNPTLASYIGVGLLYRTRCALAKMHISTASVGGNLPLEEQKSDILMHYDTDRRSKLLQLINGLDLQKLQQFKISKTRAAKLDAYKVKNGPFQNIEDILNIDGFNVKFFDKFCRSLLGEKTKTSRSRALKSDGAFIIPSMPASKLETSRSSVSVHVGVSSVTWSRLEIAQEDTPSNVTNWEHIDLTEKKLHLIDLVQRCLNIEQKIPQADCYILENPQIAALNNQGNANQININVQKAQITAVLSFALANRNRLHNEIPEALPSPNVFYLKRFLSAQLFNHLVGSERISSGDFVSKLMTNHLTSSESDNEKLDTPSLAQNTDEKLLCSTRRGNLQFPKNLQLMFSQSEHYHRELLSQTLLLNLAFVRLVLLKDSNSIARVTRNSKSKPNAADAK